MHGERLPGRKFLGGRAFIPRVNPPVPVDVQVRPFRPADTAAVSWIIRRCLQEVNRAWYPAAVIEHMVAEYGPEHVRALVRHREMLVAERGGRVVGTVGLEGARVAGLFVDPDWHGRGVGSTLMAAIEARARAHGVARVELHASLNARAFYAARGYVALGEEESAEYGRTIVMGKRLVP